MMGDHLAGTSAATKLQGADFARFQRELTKFNSHRFQPVLSSAAWRQELVDEACVARAEGEFIEVTRREIAPLVANVPRDVDAFVAWFEELRENGPGQGDPLFPSLPPTSPPSQL